jgi:hypothetical protein
MDKTGISLSHDTPDLEVLMWAWHYGVHRVLMASGWAEDGKGMEMADFACVDFRLEEIIESGVLLIASQTLGASDGFLEA